MNMFFFFQVFVNRAALYDRISVTLAKQNTSGCLTSLSKKIHTVSGTMRKNPLLKQKLV